MLPVTLLRITVRPVHMMLPGTAWHQRLLWILILGTWPEPSHDRMMYACSCTRWRRWRASQSPAAP